MQDVLIQAVSKRGTRLTLRVTGGFFNQSVEGRFPIHPHDQMDINHASRTVLGIMGNHHNGDTMTDTEREAILERTRRELKEFGWTVLE